jgi:DNA-binding NtrC family response regulator
MLESPKATRKLSSQKLKIARFRLRVVRGPDTGETRDSEGVEFTIGSAEGNHLTLNDPTVSRHHCVLEVAAEGVQIRDLGSTNGTLLNGHRILGAFVTPGVEIGLGESAVRFEQTNDSVFESLSQTDRFGPALGRSVQMRRLFAILDRVAPSEATVLIEGETGTGKGLLAEAIHMASPRRDGPFVVVDCAAIPPSLIESELFGHEKGAFTGAHSRRIGFFETGHTGTVFLDEIGELPLELQSKLLRVLENRVVYRIGTQTPIPIDVRIIAATNRDLRREVNRGAFRSDLWYRLNTVRVVVPPLRERREDIALLVAHFYQELSNTPNARCPEELIAAMQRSDWPGNVRELANAVERAIVFDDPNAWHQATDPSPEAESMAFDPSISFQASKMRAMAAWERQYLAQLIESFDGNISRAARAVRMDRSHLRTLLRRYQLRAPSRGDR